MGNKADQIYACLLSNVYQSIAMIAKDVGIIGRTPDVVEYMLGTYLNGFDIIQLKRALRFHANRLARKENYGRPNR